MSFTSDVIQYSQTNKTSLLYALGLVTLSNAQISFIPGGNEKDTKLKSKY